MNLDSKKIFIHPSDSLDLTSEVQYGVVLSKVLDKSVVLVDFASIPADPIPDTIVGSGLLPVSTLNAADLKEDTEQKLKRLQKMVRIIWEKVKIEVEIGFPEPKLLGKVREDKPYLLVLSQVHDLTYLNELFGTFEIRIAQEAACPVLILPQEVIWTQPRQMIYVTENFSGETENLIWLTDLAKRLNAAVTLVEISSKAENFRNEFPKFKSFINNQSEYEHIDYYLILAERADESLKRLIQRRKVDWLAFENQESSFLQRMFGSATTERRILGTEIPVLVF